MCTITRASLFLICFCLFNDSHCQDQPEDTGGQPALTDYIDIYQKYISSIRGSNCQMYPSCSNFGMGAYKQHNPFTATLMTADRLLRCSHDHQNYTKILTNNGIRLVDLPGQNTYAERQLFIPKSKSVLFNALDTSYNGEFINHLISNKHYREALLEINRLIFYNPDEVNEAQYLNYLVCKRALNELEDAIFNYENSFPEAIRNNPKIKNEIGNINFDLGNYDKALKIYDECLGSSSDTIIYDKSLLMKGLTYAHQKKWNESKQMFSSISDQSMFNYSKKNCLSALSFRENISYKKPFIAGVLSVIPGLGYIYSGHKQTALSSFIINGLLAYATYTSFKNENYGMTALTGLFSFSFYVGNISGSVKSAKRYNSQQDYNTINKLKSNIYY
ncbi:MAG: membrane protein insertion efficiency factor YidD [Cyclobacteriaceae bacterium]